MADNHQLTYSFDKNEIRIDYTTLTPRFSVTDNDSLDNGIIVVWCQTQDERLFI
jgi:hypothetical protein